MTKYLVSATVLALVGTTFANAQEMDDDYVTSSEYFDAYGLSKLSRKAGHLRRSYATVEGFFAVATDEIDEDFEKVNIAGILGTWGTTTALSVPKLSLDFAGVMGFGGGSNEKDYYSGELKITQGDLFVGGQAGVKCQFVEHFSMCAGLMAGIDIRYSEIEATRGRSKASNSDTAVGAFYGLFLRADVNLSNRWSLTASYRFMGTTTKNEWYGYESEKTGYSMFTVGAKFNF